MSTVNGRKSKVKKRDACISFFIPPTDIPMPCPKNPQRRMAAVPCLKNAKKRIIINPLNNDFWRGYTNQ